MQQEPDTAAVFVAAAAVVVVFAVVVLAVSAAAGVLAALVLDPADFQLGVELSAPDFVPQLAAQLSVQGPHHAAAVAY